MAPAAPATSSSAPRRHRRPARRARPWIAPPSSAVHRRRHPARPQRNTPGAKFPPERIAAAGTADPAAGLAWRRRRPPLPRQPPRPRAAAAAAAAPPPRRALPAELTARAIRALDFPRPPRDTRFHALPQVCPGRRQGHRLPLDPQRRSHPPPPRLLHVRPPLHHLRGSRQNRLDRPQRDGRHEDFPRQAPRRRLPRRRQAAHFRSPDRTSSSTTSSTRSKRVRARSPLHRHRRKVMDNSKSSTKSPSSASPPSTRFRDASSSSPKSKTSSARNDHPRAPAPRNPPRKVFYVLRKTPRKVFTFHVNRSKFYVLRKNGRNFLRST